MTDADQPQTDKPTKRRFDASKFPRIRVDLAWSAEAFLQQPATRGDLLTATDRIIAAIIKAHTGQEGIERPKREEPQYQFRIIQAGYYGHHYAQWRTDAFDEWVNVHDMDMRQTEEQARAAIETFKADVIAHRKRETPTRIIEIPDWGPPE